LRTLVAPPAGSVSALRFCRTFHALNSALHELHTQPGCSRETSVGCTRSPPASCRASSRRGSGAATDASQVTSCARALASVRSMCVKSSSPSRVHDTFVQRRPPVHIVRPTGARRGCVHRGSITTARGAAVVSVCVLPSPSPSTSSAVVAAASMTMHRLGNNSARPCVLRHASVSRRRRHGSRRACRPRAAPAQRLTPTCSMSSADLRHPTAVTGRVRAIIHGRNGGRLVRPSSAEARCFFWLAG
jgi:hypothetical protein